MPIDKIKTAVLDSREYNVKNIYLTGGEPMLHPDFNNILRLCLKQATTTVLTNGIMLNDKKTRFLRQIQQNVPYELIFRVSLDSYDETKNDSIRGYGNFRKVLSSIQNLLKYEFNPIISTVNFDDEDESVIKDKFKEVFKMIDFEAEDINFKIISPIKMGNYKLNYGDYKENEFVNQQLLQNQKMSFDCRNSRIVADDGVYACCSLVNDFRGKVGSSIKDFSKKVFLESNACYTCAINKTGMFNNDWE
jgi:molybdenum cofactor biosynthesis enzyme MoaA